MSTKLIKVDMTGGQYDKAVQDPALSALVSEGWSVSYAWFVHEKNDDGDVRQLLNFLMTAPIEPPPVSADLALPPRLMASIVAACAGGPLVGQLLVAWLFQ